MCHVAHVIFNRPGLAWLFYNFERMFIPLYVSCVMCHMSLVMCHVSHVTCNFFFWYLKKKKINKINIKFLSILWKQIGQCGGASRWRVCYQRGLLHLVSYSVTSLVNTFRYNKVEFVFQLLRKKPCHEKVLLVILKYAMHVERWAACHVYWASHTDKGRPNWA